MSDVKRVDLAGKSLATNPAPFVAVGMQLDEAGQNAVRKGAAYVLKGVGVSVFAVVVAALGSAVAVSAAAPHLATVAANFGFLLQALGCLAATIGMLQMRTNRDRKGAYFSMRRPWHRRQALSRKSVRSSP